MKEEILKIGDRVLWSGSYGREIPKEVTIKGIHKVNNGDINDTIDVDSVAWYLVTEKDFIFTFEENDRWAYAYQIQQIEGI